MKAEDGDILGTYRAAATAFSPVELGKRMADMKTLAYGTLRNGDNARYTPFQPNKRECDKVRAERDDLDYREWNADTGFVGTNRWPRAPGMLGQEGGVRDNALRRGRTERADNGF